ncbi:unnamed protein product [Cuscuta campestris]|uniref:Uncharacterized protein n=1 Tax=Cuscuta campestris TaxID=132261 RepID=A0A484K788_9ASTE|nr:unnamed protein product [Cuscuta campestris]
MGTLHEQLDEAFGEIERLKTENKKKSESCQGFMRAYNEQLLKTQSANSELAKLTLELNTKEAELLLSNQRCEELESNLKEKESAIRCLSSANDMVRADSAQKLKKLEEDNRSMSMALDEASARNMDQERKIESFRSEMERLREFVVASSQKTSSQVKKGEKASEELRQQNDDVMLKVEEVNRKLEDQLKWKKEQYDHLVEAHERIMKQFHQREKDWDEEKDTLCDKISTLQMNFESQTRHSEDLQSRLQLCNQALVHEESKRKSLEVQLSESKAFFDNVSAEYEEAKAKFENLSNQRDNDIRNLREVLRTKETTYKEMEYQFRKVEQENRELMASIKELQEAGIKEAGNFSSSKLRNKLKSLEQIHRECSTHLKSKESEWASMLENKDKSITNLQKELQDSHSYLTLVEEQKIQSQIEAHVLQETLNEALEQLERTKSELEEANKELEDNFYQSKEVEFELQLWRCLAERLEASLEENHQMRREVEASLFEQVDFEYELRRDKDRLVQILAQKEEELNELKEKIPLQQKNENKKRAFQETLELFEEEWLRKEVERAILTQIEADRNHKNLQHRLDYLQKLVMSLELEFEDSTSSFSSRLLEVLEKTMIKDKTTTAGSELENKFNVLHKNVEQLNAYVSNMTSEFVGLSDRMSQMCMEDVQLSKKLGRMLRNSSNGNFDDPIKENSQNNTCHSPTSNKILEAAAIVEDRLPLRPLNS